MVRAGEKKICSAHSTGIILLTMFTLPISMESDNFGFFNSLSLQSNPKSFRQPKLFICDPLPLLLCSSRIYLVILQINVFMNLLFYLEEVIAVVTTSQQCTVSERMEATQKLDFRVNIRLD